MAGFSPEARRMGVSIRPLRPGDRAAAAAALQASRAFSEEEVSVALEMIDAGLASADYVLPAAEIDGEVCGYACIGRTPLTRSTWHLYWICVHPRAQRQGAGQALQLHIDEFVRARGGERLVVETSGRPDYEGQRRFYETMGYQAAGRIYDYYKPGDDCILYCKVL